MNALLLFLTGGPLAASLTLFLLGKRLRKEAIHWAGLSLLGATLLSALILFWAAEGQAVLHFVWSPWVEPMGLQASATGLLAIMVTAVCGLFALWYGPSLQNRGSPALALWMIALSASNMAFLATHFALRYVALELVALVIPLSLWSEGGETRVGPLARSYLLLRLGDAGFLSGILMLAHAVGTLNIPAALAAAGQLSPGQLGYVSAGLALAVWVKMGMWPLHSWHLDGHKTSLPTRAWLYSIVPANLGLYLL